MKRTPKGATAPAFLVITSFPRYTECIGTKEQLISLYPTIESRFIDGNKYKKYGGEFYIGGKKGGLFKVRKFHEESPLALKGVLKEFKIIRTDDSKSGYQFFCKGTPWDEELQTELNASVGQILKIAEDAEVRAKKRRLTLVRPDQNTDSFTPPFIERRGRK